MRSDEKNPPSNKLPASINEFGFLDAIELSGYPLQGHIGRILSTEFGVTEEWGFIDSDSQEHRTLDVFAYRRLSAQPGPAIPGLALLVECKRSQHPYVFFKTVVDRPIPKFPRVLGIPRGEIQIRKHGEGSLMIPDVANAMGLTKFPFIEPGPSKCATFSRAEASGKRVILSGSDPFNSIVLPLNKALGHAARLYAADPTEERISPTLALCICVVDAPMFLVDDPAEARNPILAPWVRIVRAEADAGPGRSYRFHSLDIVHADFFADYIRNHVMPFAQEFCDRVTQKPEVLIRGGSVESLDDWTWDQVQPLPKEPSKSPHRR